MSPMAISATIIPVARVYHKQSQLAHHNDSNLFYFTAHTIIPQLHVCNFSVKTLNYVFCIFLIKIIKTLTVHYKYIHS